MRFFQYFVALLLLFSQSWLFANDIEFSTVLSEGQIDEQVKITFSDSAKECELHVKASLISSLLSKLDFNMEPNDSCHFEPVKRVHWYMIRGMLKLEGDDGEETVKGSGKGVIINVVNEYQQLVQAKNIGELFKRYNQAIKLLNAELPINKQLSLFAFKKKESVEVVNKYQKENNLALPKIYIKMITQFGYPKLGDFIPLMKQRSIANIYEDDYEYHKDQYQYHKGIEKNKVFYRESEDVYYFFQDNAKAVCDGEPIVDYSILTEGDYSPINLKSLDKQQNCGHFFKFLKGQVVDGFIGQIRSSFELVLPVFKENTLKAELYHNWSDDEKIDYYFEYNDIFY